MFFAQLSLTNLLKIALLMFSPLSPLFFSIALTTSLKFCLTCYQLSPFQEYKLPGAGAAVLFAAMYFPWQLQCLHLVGADKC